MIQVFVEKGSDKIKITDSKFGDYLQAHQGLYDYAVEKHGGYRKMIEDIDAYIFRVERSGMNGGTSEVRVPTK